MEDQMTPAPEPQQATTTPEMQRNWKEQFQQNQNAMVMAGREQEARRTEMMRQVARLKSQNEQMAQEKLRHGITAGLVGLLIGAVIGEVTK